MARFRFQLEPVLEQRRRAEERCQLAVAEIERQRLDIERVIRECQQGIGREKAELRRFLSGIGVPADAEVHRDRFPVQSDRLEGRFYGSAAPSRTASAGTPMPRKAMPRVALRDARFQAAAAMSLDTRARQEVLKLAGLHQRLDAARAELLRAATARKAVELLRDRRWEAWRYEQSRLESAQVDELAVMRAARKDESP